MWSPQVAALQSTHRLLVPDLRGFGGTDGFAGEPSILEMGSDLEAFLTALAIQEPLVLIGSSYGASVALGFINKSPVRVRGLVLADPWPQPFAEGGRRSDFGYRGRHQPGHSPWRRSPLAASD
jgi:pimeloyl-ACP methyl ester carboxylesterase